MKFIVNYKPSIAANGTRVAQNVTLECTEIELGYINYRVRKALKEQVCYKRLFEGLQLVGVEMMQALADSNVCEGNKRIKGDRVTYINVVLTQRKKTNRDGECITCEHATPDVKYCTLHHLSIYQDDMSCDQWKKVTHVLF